MLIGMPGAGKTTVGAALAQLMQWGFVDIDDVVAAEIGDVPTFIESKGIDAFREHEAKAIERVTDALRAGNAPDSVLAVGGGAVLSMPNRNRLADTGQVVWLRSSLATLLDHVGTGDGRPLLAGDAETAMKALLEDRTQVYAGAATKVVDVDGLDPNEIAVEVVKALSS